MKQVVMMIVRGIPNRKDKWCSTPVLLAVLIACQLPALAVAIDKAGTEAHINERRDSLVGTVDNKKDAWKFVDDNDLMNPNKSTSWASWRNSNSKRDGKFILGNPDAKAVDDMFKIHFEHFSDETKSPTVGGKADESGMSGEQTDRCNHSEERFGIGSRTHLHSWEDLLSPPTIHVYAAGLCRKCFPNPFCPDGCFWYDADLVEYILPTHKISVSNHPFYSRYMYKTKEDAQNTASNPYYVNDFVDDPDKEVPPPGNPDLQDPEVNSAEDIIIRELEFHVKERNKKPRQEIHQPGGLDIDDDRSVHVYKEVAKARTREVLRDTTGNPDEWRTGKIDDRLDDIDEDIPDEREKLIQLPVFTDTGQNDLVWTKDKRGFARHFGEPEVQAVFIPSYVPNFWPIEPYISTEKHSYLISYWLTENNREANPNPIQYYGANVGAPGNKYQNHMRAPEFCVRENIANGKTPIDFNDGGFARTMNQNDSDYDIDNDLIELGGGSGVDFPEQKPSWGEENNWIFRYCLSRVGELFPHLSWRRPHLSDHIWQTGFKTLTEYHVRVPNKAQRHTFRLDIDRIHMLPGKYSADDVGIPRNERELNDRIIDDLAIGRGVGLGDKDPLHEDEKDYQCRLLSNTIHENHKYNMTNLEFEIENTIGDTQQGEATYELFTHFAGCWSHRGVDKYPQNSGGAPFWDIIIRYPMGHQFVDQELRFW
jgi:hypothetical protein